MSRLFRFAAALWATAAGVSAEQVAITEIMYNPAGSAPEFVEVLNLTSNRIDMAEWKLAGGMVLTLPGFDAAVPSAHFLREYERVIFSSADPAATRLAYPALAAGTRVFGPWTGNLNNAGDTITVVDAVGALQSEVTYKDDTEWPVAADGHEANFYLQMNGTSVFKHAVVGFAEQIEQTLARENLKPEDIAWVVPHQANERILKAVSKRVGIPYDKFVVTISKYGNTSAASVSMALGWAAEEGIFADGDRIIFCSVGAGLTFAGGLLEW
jgi:hypothetical protein